LETYDGTLPAIFPSLANVAINNTSTIGPVLGFHYSA
jgi:hypothetical protein